LLTEPLCTPRQFEYVAEYANIEKILVTIPSP
jgi:hypothetical protein